MNKIQVRKMKNVKISIIEEKFITLIDELGTFYRIPIKFIRNRQIIGHGKCTLYVDKKYFETLQY